MAAAWDRVKVTEADVVICSSTGWAHGITVPAGCRKIVYCHNPARWVYQTHDYMPNDIMRMAFEPVRRRLQKWDQRQASSADIYLANSSQVADRIEQAYGIRAQIVHPPMMLSVEGSQTPVPGIEPGYWLAVARGRSYKNVSVIIDAVERLSQHRLVVVGAKGDSRAGVNANVRFTGVVDEAELRWLYSNARALVGVAVEDFGLTPIEANAFGTPVVVLRAGGYIESTDEGVSGVFIGSATPSSVYTALKNFPIFDAEKVRLHAAKFSRESFSRRILEIVAGSTS